MTRTRTRANGSIEIADEEDETRISPAQSGGRKIEPLRLVDRRRAASGGENWTPATDANRQTDAASQEN
jgi:hypothetical protein